MFLLNLANDEQGHSGIVLPHISVFLVVYEFLSLVNNLLAFFNDRALLDSQNFNKITHVDTLLIELLETIYKCPGDTFT
jgi:hypothetical protein